MADFTVKLIRAFELAKRVNHYYWLHTPDDSPDMRVENIQRIIEWMTRLPIRKFAVPFEGQFIRGLFERYNDRIDIYIRAAQEPEWVRFTIVKELCHALIDEEQDYSPNGEETIRELIKYKSVGLDGSMSDALISERLAEIVALELIYPLEFRERDASDVRNGMPIADIVKKRIVPSVWVQRALSEKNIEASKFFWKALAEEEPPSLKPL